jgi:hypothetical protein
MADLQYSKIEAFRLNDRFYSGLWSVLKDFWFLTAIDL